MKTNHQYAISLVPLSLSHTGHSSYLASFKQNVGGKTAYNLVTQGCKAKRRERRRRRSHLLDIAAMHLVAPFLVLLVVRRAQGRVGRHRKLLPVAHEIVKGEFIVHFASDATLAQLVHELDDLQVSKVYKGFPGAHVVGADSSTLERMLKSPLVELVEHVSRYVQPSTK